MSQYPLTLSRIDLAAIAAYQSSTVIQVNRKVASNDVISNQNRALNAFRHFKKGYRGLPSNTIGAHCAPMGDRLRNLGPTRNPGIFEPFAWIFRNNEMF